METSLVELLLHPERFEGAAQVSHFTTLEAAAFSVSQDCLHTSIAGREADREDLGGYPRYVSFTTDLDFNSGFVKNKNQQVSGELGNDPEKDKFIEVQYIISVSRLISYLDQFRKDLDVIPSDFFQHYHGNGRLAQTNRLPENEIKLGTRLTRLPQFFSKCLEKIVVKGATDPYTLTYGLAKKRLNYLEVIERRCGYDRVKVLGSMERVCGYRAKNTIKVVTSSEVSRSVSNEFSLGEKINDLIQVAAVCLYSPTGKVNIEKSLKWYFKPSGISQEDFNSLVSGTKQALSNPEALFENISSRSYDWSISSSKMKGAARGVASSAAAMVEASLQNYNKSNPKDQINTFSKLYNRKRKMYLNSQKDTLEENSSVYTITKDKLEQDAEREFQYGYDYSKVPDKVKTNVKVPIICPVHGEFLKSPENLKRGFGCPRCTESQPERVIARHLRAEGVEFSTQVKVFCVDGRERPVDFYFPDFYGPGQDAAIEVQGPSHSGGIPIRNDAAKAKQDAKLARQKTSDMLKKQYCEDNGVTLEYIPKDNSEPLARSIGGLEKQADEALERLEAKRPVSEARDFNFEDYILEGWMHKESK